MSRVADIDRYLRAYFAAEQQPDAEGVADHPLPFITISRQSGIRGHALADTIVAVFDEQENRELFGGWRVYDRTLCEMVAEDPRYASSFDSLLEEEYRSTTNDFFHQMVRSTVDQKLVMNRVFLAVRSVAGMGKAVIVGRAGSHVTADMEQGISIRVVAPEAFRIERTMADHGLSKRDAKARVRRRDADRARLLRAHFDADIDDPAGYDAIFNESEMPAEEIARAVATMVAAKA